ncbi:MAG: hypothetical protein ABR936_04575 [Bacteroidota bacterium]|jgi:hypothetical protein
MSGQNKQKEDGSKERVGYGVKIPPISFQEAIEIIKRVASSAGFQGDFDALSRVTGNTASSSTLLYKVYALKSFGLLTFQNKTYIITEIGQRISQPASIEEEITFVFEAFQKHEMLRKTWENYATKILPQPEYLANFFEKNFGIPQKLKLDWANYFTDAARYAGLLMDRETGGYQVLSNPSKADWLDAQGKLKVPDNSISSKEKESKEKTPKSAFEFSEEHWGILNQRKISGDRKAIFAIPDELTQEDIDMVRVILKGIDAGLEGLKKYVGN